MVCVVIYGVCVVIYGVCVVIYGVCVVIYGVCVAGGVFGGRSSAGSGNPVHDLLHEERQQCAMSAAPRALRTAGLHKLHAGLQVCHAL